MTSSLGDPSRLSSFQARTGKCSPFIRSTQLAAVLISGMIDWSTCPAVERDPERVSGAWVFIGTRVPISALFENLEDGATTMQFIEWFPGVTLDQVRAVLDHAACAARSVLASE